MCRAARPGLNRRKLWMHVWQERRRRFDTEFQRVGFVSKDVGKKRQWAFARRYDDTDQLTPCLRPLVRRAFLASTGLLPTRTLAPANPPRKGRTSKRLNGAAPLARHTDRSYNTPRID